MGNTDSTNGGRAKPYQQRSVSRSETASSAMMIMHCRPNRIRALDELPDTMSLAGLDHSPTVSICVNGSVKQRSLSPQQFLDEGGYGDNGQSNRLSNGICEHRLQGPLTERKNAKKCSAILSSAFRRLTSSTTPDNTSLPSNDPNAALMSGRSTASIRRVKSLRMSGGGGNGSANNGNRGSFRRQVCPFTGLTERQKKLIALRWHDQSTGVLRRAVADIFGAVFVARPTMLRFIGLRRFEHDVDTRRWRNHLLFRRHVQRFCDTLNKVVRTLHAPALSADLLMQFGADYEVMRRLYYRNDDSCCSTTASRNRREWSYDCGRRVGECTRRCRATTEKPRCHNHGHWSHHRCCDDDSSADDDDLIPSSYWEALVHAFGDTVRQLNVAEEPMGLSVSESPKLPLSGSGFIVGESSRFVLPPFPSPTPTIIDSTDVDASPPLAFDVPPPSGSAPFTLPLHHVGDATTVNVSTAFLYPSPPESTRDGERTQRSSGATRISRHSQLSRSFNTGGPRGDVNASPVTPCRATTSPKFLQSGDEYVGGYLLAPNRNASARVLRARNGRFLNGGGSGTMCQCKTGGITQPSVDDWHLLAVYVVSQIRFGYELERQLQCAAERLASMFDNDHPSCCGGSSCGESGDENRSDDNDESEECASH